MGCRFSLEVLPISVAALMSPQWIERHIHVPATATRVLVPGYCGGDLSGLSQTLGVPVERGPRDLRQLPEFFGKGHALTDGIERLFHPDHCGNQPRSAIGACPRILEQARQLAADGADVIDVGCEPGEPWRGVGDCVQALRDAGHRVSIDSFHPTEVAQAVRAGAELVLSVNGTNRSAAADWGCEVVAIPDSLQVLDSLDETVEFLAKRNVPFRIDPILEPIGLGFCRQPVAVPGRAPPLSRGGHADGDRQSDRDDRCRLGGHQRPVAGFLPGNGHSQRADDPGHQLGQEQRAGV